jgi:hypothetical protein
LVKAEAAKGLEVEEGSFGSGLFKERESIL